MNNKNSRETQNKNTALPKCSFCWKSPKDSLIANKTMEVFICAECIDACNQIISKK
jgi:hypothetical protein